MSDSCVSWRWALAAVSLASLSACVVAPRPVYRPAPVVVQQPPVAVYPQQGVPVGPPVTTVYQAPPQPQPEVYGLAPAPGYFWVPGIWLWQGNRHVWQPGRWEAPRAGQVYVPHAWVRVGQGWQLHGGHWRR